MSSISSAAPLPPASARSISAALRSSIAERASTPVSGSKLARRSRSVQASASASLSRENLRRRPAQLDLVHDDRRQRLEQAQLRGVTPRGRRSMQDSMPEHVPVVGPERHADVELEPERPGHQRMLLRARIGAGVLDDDRRPSCADRRAAEARQPRRSRAGRAAPCTDLYQTRLVSTRLTTAHRHLEHVGGERGDPVERALRRRVEDRIAPERVQPLEFRSPHPGHRAAPRTGSTTGST